MWLMLTIGLDGTDLLPFQSALTRISTLSFNPLTTADEGQYECTNNIVSPYLTGSITHTQTFDVTVSGNV